MFLFIIQQICSGNVYIKNHPRQTNGGVDGSKDEELKVFNEGPKILAGVGMRLACKNDYVLLRFTPHSNQTPPVNKSILVIPLRDHCCRVFHASALWRWVGSHQAFPFVVVFSAVEHFMLWLYGGGLEPISRKRFSAKDPL